MPAPVRPIYLDYNGTTPVAPEGLAGNAPISFATSEEIIFTGGGTGASNHASDARTLA